MNRLAILSQQISNNAAKPLKGKTVVITGASRGIGLAIGIRCAQDGANVAILAKTVKPQPTLPGIFCSIQALFTQLQRKSKSMEEKLFLFNVTSEVKKVSRNAFRKLLILLEESTF